MRKFCLLNKLCLSLCIATVLMCLGSYSEVKAQPFTFHPTDFTFAKWGNSQGVSHQIDYLYHLTTATQNQAVVMWHNQPLSMMEQEWVFNFSIEFGNATSSGIAFVMYPSTEAHHNKATLVGQPGGYLGVPQYESFFRIEFDTEYDNIWELERFAGFQAGNGHGGYHIAYMLGDHLAGGTPLTTGSNTQGASYAPLQNNWASVKGQTLCVSIHWKFVNGVDKSAGYYLITYIQEKSLGSDENKMFERIRMRFTSLDEFIPGLQNSVNFGITAATGSNPNTQSINFSELRTGYAAKITLPLEINLVSQNKTSNIETRNNLYRGIPGGCNSLVSTFPQSPLSYPRIICIDDGNDYNIEIINGGMPGLNWQWYIDGSPVDANPTNNNVLNLNAHRDLYDDVSPATITVTAKKGNETVTFNFTVSKNENNNMIFEAFANHLNSDEYENISVEGNVGTLTITDNELSQSITLPKTDGCLTTVKG